MKRALIELLLWAFLLGVAAAQSADPIQKVSLNPLVVARIPVARTGPTTIRFPSPISDLEGAFISSDPASSALFLLTFRPGSAFFSVRALAANANTSLNVVWKDQTYVLELVESKKPWLSVIFTQGATAAAPIAHQPVTPSRLLGLLDTAKAFPLLKTQHPEAVAGVECARPNTFNDYGDYTINTEEVFRFDGADTLVFRIVVSNKTGRVMRYLPQSLMVQAGQRVFYQSITDAKGEIPAQTSAPVYFAITGTSDGGRNDASPHNEFLVLLHRLDPPSAPSSSPLPAPALQPRAAPSAAVPEKPAVPPVPAVSSSAQPSDKLKSKLSSVVAQPAIPTIQATTAQVNPIVVTVNNYVTAQAAGQPVPVANRTCADRPQYAAPYTPNYYYYYPASQYSYYPVPSANYRAPAVRSYWLLHNPILSIGFTYGYAR